MSSPEDIEENYNEKNEESASKKQKLDTDVINMEKEIKYCKFYLVKKQRSCKFNALRDLDYCVAHLASNDQSVNSDKRVVCPLDPKHSVYEKNLTKHLKKCNAKDKCLGTYDIKDINTVDKNDQIPSEKHQNINPESENQQKAQHPEFTTYKEVDQAQLNHIIDLLDSFDKKFNLYNLEFNKLNDEYLDQILIEKNDKNNKHLEQISSIVSHVEVLLQSNKDDVKDDTQSTCLVELGAGRGKLSYWYEQSRNNKSTTNNDYIKEKLNVLLIERGSQRFKFDYFLKEQSSYFERIRIDLKDFYLNEVDLIKKSNKYLLYGKHLCGVATDYAIRSLKFSLEDFAEKNNEKVALPFSGLVLAVCCHNQCVWESFCGKKFFEELLIDSKMFYILRSITSWYVTGSEANKQTEEEIIHGINKQKIGRICKNLFDFARLNYLKESIKLPQGYRMNAKLFYYVEKEVTLENTMIYAYLEST